MLNAHHTIMRMWDCTLGDTATHCNSLQHTIAHYNTDFFHHDRYSGVLMGMRVCVCMYVCVCTYGVATVSWLLKLYVSLENIGLFCRALLQKRPIVLRSLLMVASPYAHQMCRKCNICMCCACTLQHTAAHCNTLLRTATHCNTLLHTATHCHTLKHTATHCNALSRAVCTYCAYM